jgi:hypothetical protein
MRHLESRKRGGVSCWRSGNEPEQDDFNAHDVLHEAIWSVRVYRYYDHHRLPLRKAWAQQLQLLAVSLARHAEGDESV